MVDAATRSKYPNVLRWFLTLRSQPTVLKVMGPINLPEKSLVFIPGHNYLIQKDVPLPGLALVDVYDSKQ